MIFPQLLAKSRKENEPFHNSMRLSGHLDDVHRAAQRVLDSTQDHQLYTSGCQWSNTTTDSGVWSCLRQAVHDLGKANDHFQGMIYGTRDIRTQPQGLRHEWVSLLMLKHLEEWFLPAVGGSNWILPWLNGQSRGTTRPMIVQAPRI